MVNTAPVTVLSSSPAPAARSNGILLAVGGAMAFAGSGPLTKPLLEGGWSLTAVLTIRMAAAGLVLSPALVRAFGRGLVAPNLRIFLLFGLAPVFGCQILFFSAMQRMPVAIALLVQYLAPVILVLFVWLRTRKTPAATVLIGTVVAVAGLVLVVNIFGARVDTIGVLLALGAAVCVCFYFVLAERTGDSLPPLALASGGLLIGAAMTAAIGVVGLIPFRAPAITTTVLGWELPGWVVVTFVGAVATSLGYALGVMAVPRIGMRVASFVGLSEVLFALLFSWLLLGEAPTWVQALGGALILVGIVLIRRDGAVPVVIEPVTGAITLPAPPAAPESGLVIEPMTGATLLPVEPHVMLSADAAEARTGADAAEASISADAEPRQ